ncbi:MAG: hypothetical protein FJZ90_00820 [Chloroflexi bacterium]|nr:hypothetical protein [Chloroflexota bacterium]
MGSKRSYEALGGGIFLIGLGLLFLVPGIGFWPWILVVIGAAGLPAALANEQGWAGWQGFVWLVGLAVLFASGLFWPGILILAGLSILLGALTRESAGSPFAHPKARSTGETEEKDESFTVGGAP